jgi:hypothetical protein
MPNSEGGTICRTFPSSPTVAARRMGDRDGPSAAAAGRGGEGTRRTAHLSRWRGTDPAWVGTGVGTRWEQIVSPRDSPCPLVSPRNSLVCRGFPIRTGNAGPLGPPSTEPKVTGSNPVGRALEKALQSQNPGQPFQTRRRRVGTRWEQDSAGSSPGRACPDRARAWRDRASVPHLKLYERRPMNGTQLLLDHAVPSRGSLWPTDSRRWRWPA